MVADATFERPWLRIERDKKYGLGSVDVRFEVPADTKPSRGALELFSHDVVLKAVDQFERLGDGKGHKFKRADWLPVTYHLSQMPTKEQIDRFNQARRMRDIQGLRAVPVGAAPMIVFIARVWFVRPLDEVNLDQLAEEQKYLNEQQGYVSPENMPDEWKWAEEHEHPDSGADNGSVREGEQPG